MRLVHECPRGPKRKEEATGGQKEGELMIIAVDFDGILCENQFPNIGPPNYTMVSFVRELIDMGHEVVLWTSRVDQPLRDAVAWCEDRGLHFCAVNDNAPSNKAKYEGLFPGGTRKVDADIYIDDHNPAFLRSAYSNGYEMTIIHTIDHIRRILKWQEEN